MDALLRFDSLIKRSLYLFITLSITLVILTACGGGGSGGSSGNSDNDVDTPLAINRTNAYDVSTYALAANESIYQLASIASLVIYELIKDDSINQLGVCISGELAIDRNQAVNIDDATTINVTLNNCDALILNGVATGSITININNLEYTNSEILFDITPSFDMQIGDINIEGQFSLQLDKSEEKTLTIQEQGSRLSYGFRVYDELTSAYEIYNESYSNFSMTKITSISNQDFFTDFKLHVQSELFNGYFDCETDITFYGSVDESPESGRLFCIDHNDNHASIVPMGEQAQYQFGTDINNQESLGQTLWNNFLEGVLFSNLTTTISGKPGASSIIDIMTEVNDYSFLKARNEILAVTKSGDTTYPSNLVTIDVETGMVTNNVILLNEPVSITISNDQSKIYVGYVNIPQIDIFDPISLEFQSTLYLLDAGININDGSPYAADFHTSPNNNSNIIVIRVNGFDNPFNSGYTLIEDDIFSTDFEITQTLDFTFNENGSTAYSLNLTSSAYGLDRFFVYGSSLGLGRVRIRENTTYGRDIFIHNNNVYFSNGKVFAESDFSSSYSQFEGGCFPHCRLMAFDNETKDIYLTDLFADRVYRFNISSQKYLGIKLIDSDVWTDIDFFDDGRLVLNNNGQLKIYGKNIISQDL